MTMSGEKGEQRRQLIQALNESGMAAREFIARDGKKYVVVPLLDTSVTPILSAAQDPELRAYFRNSAKAWPHPAYLHICSGSPSAPWEIGVIGHDGQSNEDYTPEDWETANTLGEAVKAFEKRWEGRDALLNAFTGDMAR